MMTITIDLNMSVLMYTNLVLGLLAGIAAVAVERDVRRRRAFTFFYWASMILFMLALIAAFTVATRMYGTL